MKKRVGEHIWMRSHGGDHEGKHAVDSTRWGKQGGDSRQKITPSDLHGQTFAAGKGP